MQHYLKSTIILLLLILWVTPSFGQDYIIGEDDVVRISVYDNPDLEKVDRVSNEGMIVLPLIGPVMAKGLTVAGLSKKITALLADGYLVDPHVSVFVEQFRSQKVTILGAINTPGLYEISGDISLLELVSKAGGFTTLTGNEAVITRLATDGTQNKTTVPVNLQNFLVKGDTSMDVPLKHGDSIFVKRADVYYVNGEVRNPDMFKLEEGMTVIKALTMANGFTDKAARNSVRIIRKVKGKEQVFEKVKMDMPVQADDIIVVPESFF